MQNNNITGLTVPISFPSFGQAREANIGNQPIVNNPFVINTAQPVHQSTGTLINLPGYRSAKASVIPGLSKHDKSQSIVPRFIGTVIPLPLSQSTNSVSFRPLIGTPVKIQPRGTSTPSTPPQSGKFIPKGDGLVSFPSFYSPASKIIQTSSTNMVPVDLVKDLTKSINQVKFNIITPLEEDCDPYDTELLIDNEEDIEDTLIHEDSEEEKEEEDNEEEPQTQDQSDNQSDSEGDVDSDPSSFSGDEEGPGMTHEELLEEKEEEIQWEYDVATARLEELHDLYKEYYGKSQGLFTMTLEELSQQIQQLDLSKDPSNDLEIVNQLISKIDCEINQYEEREHMPYIQVKDLDEKMAIANLYQDLANSKEWKEQVKQIPAKVIPHLRCLRPTQESDIYIEEKEEESSLILTNAELNQLTRLIDQLQNLINRYEEKLPYNQVNKRKNVYALNQIRQEQKRTDPIIPKDNFKRLAKEILQDFDHNGDISFDQEALESLQIAAEDYLIQIFDQAGEANALSKRKMEDLLETNRYELDDNNVTLTGKDINLAYQTKSRRLW